MKKLNLIGLLAIVIVTITGCADVSHVQNCLPPAEHTYGFWAGMWHGMIMVPSFIGSLIWDDVAIYAVNNNGGWYDFGFVGGFWFLLKMVGHAIKSITS